ncbi:hypothetical protein NLI96_g6371 [Meripilus lineatus]|uniref:YCII-related domain-containing protein n=1 Tax=Meripilus lineatus TaxID=2056292 RepID=A0AAD5V5Z8_9APHY|nr:hypothetical protein NLI96_g6371 [Physisporinus lineatus]
MADERASPRLTFHLFAPDCTDSECLSRRLAVRPQHLVEAAKVRHNVTLKVGGALLAPITETEGGQKKMVGSMMLCEADCLEDVKAWVEEDIYYTSNVWDKQKIVILPFVAAITN